MRKLELTLLFLFFELCTLHGHVITKREATDVDRYAVKSDKNTIEIINPKAKKPTLRDIIFFHVIEKPYPDIQQKIIINNDDEMIPNDNDLILKDDNKVQINDSPRPWTNGHGFQFLDANNLNDQIEADNAEPLESQGTIENDVATSPDIQNDELFDDKPQNVINDDILARENANDQENGKYPKDVESELTEEVKNNNNPNEENERPAEENVTETDGIADGDLRDNEELPKVNPVNKNGISDLRKIEDDKTIRFRDFINEGEGPRGARSKRDIDYSKMHDAPPLPLFKTDFFPDYIKEILPPDDFEKPTKPEQSAFLSRRTKKPAYLSRTTEKPAYLSRTTEEDVYLTEKPEVAKKPVYLSKTTKKPIYVSGSNEKPDSVPKISVRIGDSDEQKLKRKSAKKFDEEVGEYLSEAIRKVAEAQDMNTEVDYPSSGMNLIGNTGVIWNDLNGQHFRFNVGPDATNTEDHNAQIPVKPSKDKPEDTTEKDAIPIDLSSEIESAFEEIGHIFEEILEQIDNQEDTESDKVTTTENYDIHVNINKDHDKHENFEENTKKPNDFKNEESKFDEIQSLDEQAETEPVENSDDRVIDFINAIKDLIENSKKNESESHENGVNDKVIEPQKDSNKDDSKSNDEIEDDSDTRKNKRTNKAIRQLLDNENYWEWLKDMSESYMNIIMKQVLGLIKQEVSNQIQHLVTKMMEEQGDAPPSDHDDKQMDKHDSDSKTKRHKNEKENGGDDSKPHSLKSIDKYWDWLEDSSVAYFNILFKRLLRIIAEGVAVQIETFGGRMFKEIGYTLPKKDENITKRDDDEEDSKVIETLKRNEHWKWLTKSSEAYLDKIKKRVNRLLEEEVNRQVSHLVKYHMPSKNDEQTSTEESHDEKQENENNLDANEDSDSKNDNNLDANEDSDSKNDNNLDANKDSDSKNDTNIDANESSDSKNDTNIDANNDNDSELDEQLSKKTIEFDESKDELNEKKHKGGKDKKKKKAENVKITTKNAYGTSLNNEKVTNIFIFGLNRKDFNKIKPVSSGNGIYVFGTDYDDKKLNIDSDKQTTEITERNDVPDDSNTDPIPNEDKVEITTVTPVKDKEELESTDSDTNKEENDKDNSKETEKDNPQKPEEEPKASTGENQTEDSDKSGKDNENTDKDSKDTQNTHEDLNDEDNVEIDERLGEILVGESKDKEIKDKESNETTTETSIDKSRDEDKVKKDEPKDKEIQGSSENVKDTESNETTTETSIDKSSDEDKVEIDEAKDKEINDSSENVKDKESNETTTETSNDKSSE